MREPIERFGAKYEVAPDGCWRWTGVHNRDGYGSFWNGERFPGKEGKRGGPVMVLAHRWAFEFFCGPIPVGLNVLHRCDNPDCVNPNHLFLGTQADNVKDCIDKGRRGKPIRWHKLSREVHEEIARRYELEGISQSELGAEYGITQAMVSHIVRRARA